jgi:dephospho-CoA kinase
MSEFIVAITGGVASGKSTVDALFRSHGLGRG